MTSTRDLQRGIVAHKQRTGFNTTDPAKEMDLLRSEVNELDEALTTRDATHVGHELADVAIYLLTLAEMHGLDLGDEIERKMVINRSRRYETGPDGTPVRVKGTEQT